MEMIVGTRFQLKLTILNFERKFAGGAFPAENGKSEYHEWILHFRICLSAIFQLKLTILISELNLLKKGISSLKQKNRSFACAQGRYLLY